MRTTKQAVRLTTARLLTSSEASAVTPSVQAGAARNIHAMPGAAFKSNWYRPERLMSQSERLPS
ncbi:MAG TPA: hypothetical protein VMS00_04580 [Acidimicrobiales bacterium]|jgi:hypothetical protein|nr:hypothetical protein [Acidimicrobiales bacterium]